LLVQTSNLLIRYGWAALLTLLAVSAVMVHLYQTEAGQRFFDGLKLKVPGLGPLIHRSSLSRMIHALSALSKAHVPLACALPWRAKQPGTCCSGTPWPRQPIGCSASAAALPTTVVHQAHLVRP
jgi:type II secretory pathway component PulF